ncbi:MAG: tetratricopeptide repeat protein, partial [Myxococcales bacterium]|nr:tetratricopeptide repeat protein [Myxococcales bacterium]
TKSARQAAGGEDAARATTADAARAGGAAPTAAKADAPPDTTGSPLLDWARRRALSGHCAAAVPAYERWLKANGADRSAPYAMLEVASCYRAVGDPASARRWLELALTIPSVSDAAHRALEALDAAAPPAESP